jgi:superfamily II DNA/RNA helicase
MADLGFLPVVRRLLDRTPRDCQRLMFSATLDSGVDVLVRRYLHDPVKHDSDPVVISEPNSTHHVLYIQESEHLAVLVDLTAAPGRSIVFTRTKHRAKALTRKLVAAGVPAVELHGNLAQNARDRNLTAFTTGTATTLVATDIAARGIHVDDVRIIIHADPPAEHKAYVHRSGRTARAGASGTVITLSTDAQQAEVRDLARRAGVSPTATRISPGHPLLSQLAPGQRTFVEPPPTTTVSAAAPAHRPSRSARSGRTSTATPSTSIKHTANRSRSTTEPARATGVAGHATSGAAAFSKSTRARRRTS